MATQSRIGWRPYVTQVVNAVDADTTAFIAAAGITDLTQAAAISTLVNDLKAYGLWTKMKALYPFVGGSATSHKFNLKDPRNLDAAYRLVFNGGWVHSSKGALPNGTTGYADTFFIPSTNLGAYSVHLSYYSKTNRTYRNSIAIGAWQDSPTHNTIDLRLNGNNAGGDGYSVSAMFDGWNGLDYASYATTRSDYFLIGSKTAINLNKVYENGALKGTNTTTSTRSIPNVRVLIGAEGRGTTGATNYDNLESAFASIGDGLTDTEASNFYTSVQKFQTTLGRHVGTPYVSDPDAIAFLMAAGITDGTQAAAINTLVIRMKADGVWTKMKAIYPFVGGNATSHKFNLKDPRDIDAAYRLVFNGGWTHSSTGALPNGTTGYAETYFMPSTSLTLYSSHLSYYSRTNSTRPTWTTEFSVEKEFSTGVISSMTLYAGSNTWAGAWITSTDSARAYEYVGRSSDFFIGSRTSTNNIKIYRNGLITGSSSITANLNGYLGAQYPTYSPTIGARKKISTTNSVSYEGFSNRECSFASIGDGLTDTEAANFYTAVQTYQTTLGRQVNVPLVSDTDAQSFLNSANITSFQQASAVNKLVIDLKAAGVWTKMKAIYPFVGGSATSHKWNLKDPRDIDAAYRLIFNGGWVHSSTGAKPNGTNGYANTYLVPSTRYTDSNSISIGFYSRTNISENSNDIGSMQSTLTSIGIQTRWTDNKIYGVCYDDSVRAIIVNNLDSTGFFTLSRTTTTSLRLYKNETTLGSYTNTVTGSLPTAQINLGSYNGLVNFSTREQALAFIGDGLSETETLSFYAAVQTYQTSLGRAVNTPVYNNNLVLNLDAGNANSYPGTGTTWFDLSSGNNGTLVNGPTYDATSGGSILFDGTNDYANFGNVQSLNSLTSGVTIGAWIKSSSTTTYSAILQKWYQSGMQGGFQLFISSGGILTLAIGDFITGYSGGSSTVSVITGSWVYVTATYDMNAIKIYINGVLNSTTSLVRSVVNSNNATLFLGQDDYGGRFFRGNISSATVHNRALTSTEILSNFNSTRGRFGL